MHNLFAILAILAAVVVLGVFRVPDENALVAAGIKAEAQAALYQARHPLAVEVTGRTVTVSGRVESEAAGQDVVAQLAALEGVEEVVNRLTILPRVAPFALSIRKTPDGYTAEGHVPHAAVRDDLAVLLGREVDLPLATGAPDRNWGDVALAGARALAALHRGEVVLTDSALTLTGKAHLPQDLRSAQAALADLPEGYGATLEITTLDDGRPYSLLASRDPLTGLRLVGKLPPDTDLAVLDSLGTPQQSDLTRAPLPLEAPGFAEVLGLALPLFQGLDAGVMSLSPGLLAVQGGPMPQKDIARITALADQLPEGWQMSHALIPDDSRAPLALTAKWDGAVLAVSGRVPKDFDAGALGQALLVDVQPGLLERTPYPDLAGWAQAQIPALRALSLLDEGEVTTTQDGTFVEGVAADPLARKRAASALGDAGVLDVVLKDDGAPPRFTLSYDATRGGSVTGKLPRGVSLSALAEALGLAELRGRVPVSPDPAAGELALAALSALRPWMAEVESLTLLHAPEGVALDLQTPPGVSAPALEQVVRQALPNRVSLTVAPMQPPLAGTRRMHHLLQIPQVYAAGLWLPELGFAPGAESCAEAAPAQSDIPFKEGGFDLALGAALPFAHLVALTRACTRLAGLTAHIEVGAEGSGFAALDRQLARRRAEALREILQEHGVPEAQLSTAAKPQGAGLSLRFTTGR